jgi:hypothetical protein
LIFYFGLSSETIAGWHTNLRSAIVTILSGDVKLLASQVMLDVPEGGGAPTAIVIADGASNAIFPDISERDRAGGRVNTIKVFAAVQTDTVDSYYGPNVILADPPKDPRVSVTLFLTNSFFETRAGATSRIESYLNKGPEWPGYLYENHIAGQRVIQLFQFPDAEIVRVGHTLVLAFDEGKESEIVQYVRATSVDSVIRRFYDPASNSYFDAAVVSVTVSDSLRYDFQGSPASKTFAKAAGKTIVRDTTVSDAGSYVGAVPLARAANRTDFTIDAAGVYTQLVPSAQIETPLVDVNMAGQPTALQKSGSAVSLTLTCVFTTTSKMFIGMSVFPGTFTLTRNGATVTDKAGVLMNNAEQCGTIDYSNGIISLTKNLFGTSGGQHVVTFTPAFPSKLATDSYSFDVTTESRRLSYVVTLSHEVLPMTLSVAYMSGGRWYVLRETGSGEIKGISSAHGVGTLNFDTSSVVVTLGALPDVGSVVLFTYCSNQDAAYHFE